MRITFSRYETNSNQAKNFTFKQNVYFCPANVICKVGRCELDTCTQTKQRSSSMATYKTI